MTWRERRVSQGLERTREKETHERDLLDIDSTSEEIGGDEDTGRSRAELLHDDLALLLLHISVHGWKEARRGQLDSRRRRRRKDEPETVNSRLWSLSVSQSTFLRVLQKMTAWVMVTVS